MWVVGTRPRPWGGGAGRAQAQVPTAEAGGADAVLIRSGPWSIPHLVKEVCSAAVRGAVGGEGANGRAQALQAQTPERMVLHTRLRQQQLHQVRARRERRLTLRLGVVCWRTL